MLELGPISREQISRFGRTWAQGDHVLITGPTNSGKTTLARHVVEQRLQRHGFVVVFVCKFREDPTITSEYSGWTRWTHWKKRPGIHESRVLLWPDTDRMNLKQARAHQAMVFTDALERLSKTGRWTVQFDEGLIMCSKAFLNLGDPIGMLHAIGRTSNLSLVDLAQRPSHLPVIIYPNLAHAFVGRTREYQDVKRLSELDGKTSSKEIGARISVQGRRDFLWIPIAPDWPPESVNLKR